MVRTIAVLLLMAAPALAFPVPKPARTLAIAGTTWESAERWDHGESHTCTITFSANGTLIYNGGIGNNSGRWQQDGNTISFDINNFSRTELVIEGDALQGSISNKSGQKGSVKFSRQRTP